MTLRVHSLPCQEHWFHRTRVRALRFAAPQAP